MILDDEIFYYLPKEKHSFYDRYDDNYLVHIKWSKKIEEDYAKLADNYFKCGYKAYMSIVESDINNIKYDMWILPSIYMLRQSIELFIKALVYRGINSKKESQQIFIKCKHNVYKCYKEYIKTDENYLDSIEKKWIESYLMNIEDIDAKSDLFRFPFNNDFMSQYRNKFLDISDIGNNLLQCCSLLKKCVDKGENIPVIKFDANKKPKFLQFASHGIGNCYLCDWISSDVFHKQIKGYNEVAKFLFSECDDLSNQQKAYPLIFLYRNTIELELKRMFYKTIEFSVSEKEYKKRKSHKLYEELWKNVKPMIEHYAKEMGQDMSIIDNAENQLKEINKMDKNGYMFRYPTSYSFEYKFNNKYIDISNIFIYMQSIVNFLEGCNSMFIEVEEFEAECRAEMNNYYENW